MAAPGPRRAWTTPRGAATRRRRATATRGATARPAWRRGRSPAAWPAAGAYPAAQCGHTLYNPLYDALRRAIKRGACAGRPQPELGHAAAERARGRLPERGQVRVSRGSAASSPCATYTLHHRPPAPHQIRERIRCPVVRADSAANSAAEPPRRAAPRRSSCWCTAAPRRARRCWPGSGAAPRPRARIALDGRVILTPPRGFHFISGSLCRVCRGCRRGDFSVHGDSVGEEQLVGGFDALVDASGAHRALSDCHSAVHPDRFIPVSRSCSVAVILK